MEKKSLDFLAFCVAILALCFALAAYLHSN